VVGTIDSKCEFGYFVSVPVGGQTLSGTRRLPPSASERHPPCWRRLSATHSGLDSGQLMHRRRKEEEREDGACMGCCSLGRVRLLCRSRAGRRTTDSFGEWRTKLKAELPDVPDREISRMIGQQWMALSAEQRLVSGFLQPFVSPMRHAPQAASRCCFVSSLLSGPATW